MNILVTGGLGYIGAHIVKYLNQNCKNYKVVVTDISDIKENNNFRNSYVVMAKLFYYEIFNQVKFRKLAKNLISIRTIGEPNVQK